MLLSDIANVTGLKTVGPDVEITGINTLESAGKSELSFLVNPKYLPLVATSKAAAVLCEEKYADHTRSALISSSVYLDLARIGSLFDHPQGECTGISDQAYVDSTANLGENVTIYPFAFIGPDVTMGDGSRVFPGTYIGERCVLGKGVTLFPNVVLMSDTTLGDNVTIHAGTVIGADGFGYAQGPTGHMKIPQIGRVFIEDNVEIGSNTCIDRAALDVTSIGRGTKIDNLVQVAHNVTMGEHCLAASQVGISGSVRIGNGVVMGGASGYKDNIEIGDGAMIGGRGGVTNSLKPGAQVSGYPHMEIRKFLRVSAAMPRLPDALKRLRQLEKQVEALTKALEEK